MSGDIETNPGPVYTVLDERLQQFQLRPFDVGGEGDCFFRAVSHQLYGDPSHHIEIREAGITYMRDNPQRFIESNTEYSWLQYLNNMSMQGTWCDHMIIQAIADQRHLRIFVIETQEGFGPFNIIQAVSSLQTLTYIYLGHLGEYHNVSTTPYAATSLSSNEQSYSQIGENLVHNSNTQQRTKQMFQEHQTNLKKNQQKKEYMRNKRLNEDIQTKQKINEKKREYMKRKRSTSDLEVKHKNNE